MLANVKYEKEIIYFCQLNIPLKIFCHPKGWTPHNRTMPATCPHHAHHARTMLAQCPHHARIMPAPCPYHARTMPAPCPHRVKTVCRPTVGDRDGRPHLLAREPCVGRAVCLRYDLIIEWV